MRVCLSYMLGGVVGEFRVRQLYWQKQQNTHEITAEGAEHQKDVQQKGITLPDSVKVPYFVTQKTQPLLYFSSIIQQCKALLHTYLLHLRKYIRDI